MTTIEFTTNYGHEALDITDLVVARLADHAGSAFAWISTPHTTAALMLCESDDEMLRDIERLAAYLLAPFEPFQHRKNDNPNAAAHLFSSLVGTQLILPVDGDRLELGTYQRLIFVELDGPRPRRVQLSIVAAG